MIHDIRFQANWDRIKNNKQNIIATSNNRENLNRIKHKYNVGDRILLRIPGHKTEDKVLIDRYLCTVIQKESVRC
jgi:hypothetical protein